jgi:molybdenum cofactor biosynthesis enzyme MoaA
MLQVNVVLQRGVNDDEVADFVEMTRHQPINVRFIEYMPFDGNVWSTGKMVPYREVMQRINDRWAAGQRKLRPLQLYTTHSRLAVGGCWTSTVAVFPWVDERWF